MLKGVWKGGVGGRGGAYLQCSSQCTLQLQSMMMQWIYENFDLEHTQCSDDDDNSENKGITIGNDNRKNREAIANQQNDRDRNNNSFVESSSNTNSVRRYPALTSSFMAAKPFLACNRTTVAAFAKAYPEMVNKHLHGGRARDGERFAVGARNLLAAAKSVFDALGIKYWINSGTAKICAFAHANL